MSASSAAGANAASSGDSDSNDDMIDSLYDNNMAAVAATIAVAVLLVAGLVSLICVRHFHRKKKATAIRRAQQRAGAGTAAADGVSVHSQSAVVA